MTPVALLAELRARGVELRVEGDRLRYRPVDRVGMADVVAMRQLKPELMALLLQPPRRDIPAADDWADGVPDGPCGLCGSSLAWVEDWPCAGEGRWLCPSCADRSSRSLETIYGSLTIAERQRLVEEARGGDVLGQLLLKLVPAAGAA